MVNCKMIVTKQKQRYCILFLSTKFLFAGGQTMQMKKLMKKAAAVFAAGVLGTTLLPASAFAADSFTAALQEDFDANIDASIQQYGAALAASQQEKTSIGMNVSATLGEGGKQLLAATGIDFSWLNKVALDCGIKIDDLNATLIAEALVNDQHIANLNMIMDIANMVAYMQVPELTDAYAYMSMNSALQQSGIDPAMYKQLMNMSKTITQYYPTPEQMDSILKRYVPIILGALQNQPNSNASVTAAGISVDCTVYEATLDEKGAAAMVQALNDAVATDTDLEAVLDNFGALFAQLGQPVDLYEQLKASLAEAAQGASQSDFSSTEYIDFRLYEAADGSFAALTMDGYDSPGVPTSYFPSIAIKCPKNGDNFGFEASMSNGGEAYSITGTGTLVDGTLNGTFNVNAGPQAVATVTVTDAKSDDAGNSSGSVTLQVLASELTQSNSSLMMLTSFTPVISWNIDQIAQSFMFDFGVLSGGVSLGNLTFTAAPKEVAGMGAPSAATSYNLEDDTQMNSWASGINFETILGNLTTAGVPEALIQQVLGGAVPGAAAPAAEAPATEAAPAEDAAAVPAA